MNSGFILKAKKGESKKPCRKIKVSALQDYSLAAVPLLYILLFSYIPMVGLVIAFKDYRYDKGMFGSDWVRFDNFKFFFTSNDFLRVTRNTILLNALFIVIGITCAVALAIALFSVISRTKTKVFQTVLITPHFLSWVVVGYMVYAFLNPVHGMVNTILKSVGAESIDWYSKPNAWPAILTISSVWKHIGMDCVLYYAALMGMDTSLFEAAEVDGATKWQVRRYIIIPSLVQIITITAILKIGHIFRADFGLFYQVTRDVGTLYPTTDVMDTYIFRTMKELGDMGMSTAAGFLQSVVGLVTVIVTNHITKKINPDNALF